ncbi:MAG: recombinase family protein, partial [Patescibacteria group bacterium]
MKYILYCRKSTDSEDRQVLSLDSQEKELLSIAEKNNLTVVKTFKESRTAKDAGRPLFGELVQIIQSGKADAILCWKLDRLARNFLDGGLIMDMLQKGIIKEIRTYESIHLPNETAFIMAMQFGMANQYSRDLSVNVKRGNRARLEKGGWPNKAPFGYLNDKANKTVYIDEARAKYVIKAFEMYASGAHSLKAISNALYEHGFRTVGGTKVHRSHIHRFISNPFYCGLMRRDHVLYSGTHEPLVSKDLFDRAQLVLQGKHHQKTKTLFFPLRGFLRCETCGCTLTASLKKGHQYYYCTNGKGICAEHKSYIREEALYKIVSVIFDRLSFSERKIELMYRAAKERLQHDDKYDDSVLKTLQNRLESIKTKESRLLDTFMAEQIPKELYDTKVLEIHNERVSLNRQIGEAQANGMKASITLEPTKEIFMQGSRAKTAFLEADGEKRR